MDAGSRGGEDSHEDGASGLGHMVAMSARHFLRKTMGPQQPEFAADDCRTASPLLIRSGLRIVEQCLQIPVAKAVDGNSPWWMAVNRGLSSPQGRRPRIRRLFQTRDF